MGEWGTCGLSRGRAEGCKGGRAERGLQGAVSLLRPPTRRRATSLTWEVSSLFGPKHPSAQESNGGHAGGCPLGRCLSGTVGSEKDAFLGVSGWPQNQSQQLGSHCAHTHTQTQTHMHTHRHTPHLPGEKGLPFAVRKLRLRAGWWQDPSRAHPEGRSWFPGQPPCDGESALRPEDRDSRVLSDSVCQVRGKEGPGECGAGFCTWESLESQMLNVLSFLFWCPFWVNDFCSVISCPVLHSHVANLIKPWLLSPENMCIHIKFNMESQGFPEPIA